VKSRALTLAGPSGPLSAELLFPDAPEALIVFAHGAGADFRHANMVGIADAFAAQDLATLRFNFPFMEHGRRRVDSREISIAAIECAVVAALEEGLPVYLGGHSFGGRMASHAVAEHELPVHGLILCSYPLHQPRRPSRDRATHLAGITIPMLFLSGTRDALAEPELLEAVVADLGARARLHWLMSADHSYKILKRQRPDGPTVFEEMAAVARTFVLGR